MADRPALIALDWGTTALRAYLVGADGQVLQRSERQLGVLHVAGGDFAGALRDMTGPWREAHAGLPALASGMVGSRQGWREVPYAQCPAGLAELARGVLTVDAGDGTRLGIVPGLTVTDADGVPDVMRGEETQVLGMGRGDGVVVLPGSHSKWARVKGGRILGFATFMTGEAFAALHEHTILRRLITSASFDKGGFARGLEHAGRAVAGRGGLLHRLFSARSLGLFAERETGLSGAALHSYLSGLMIGTEVAEACAWLRRTPGRVTVIGAPALTALYEKALHARGIAVVTGPADAAALGLWRIARAAGLIA